MCPHCGTGLRPSQALRDDGDGSSSSTNADEPAIPSQFVAPNTNQSFGAAPGSAPGIGVPFNGPGTPTPSNISVRRTESRERLLEESIQRQRTVFNGMLFYLVCSVSLHFALFLKITIYVYFTIFPNQIK